MELAYFVCPACENTAVYRPTDSARPIPYCLSCEASHSGCTEMVWIEDRKAKDLNSSVYYTTSLSHQRTPPQ